MNRLIASALLGFGLASGVVACSDDDDGAPSDTGGTASGGSSVAGKNAGGTGQSGGEVGGTGGKSTAGSGGTAAGSGGKPEGGTNAGGVPAGGAGGDESIAGQAAGGDGEGGAGGAPEEQPPQPASSYWLNKFCESQASETLACEFSGPWFTCYDKYSPFLSEGQGGGLCTNEKEEDINMEMFPLTIALFDQLAATAAACGITSTEDWRCNISGSPIPVDQRCQEENDKLQAADAACGGSI